MVGYWKQTSEVNQTGKMVKEFEGVLKKLKAINLEDPIRSPLSKR